MRQYRGLTKEGKVWVYGWYCKIEGVHYIIDDTVSHTWLEEDCYEVQDIRRLIEVIPETVGQYTGRKDKNGLEIYEGDKEVGREGIQGIVLWLEDSCSFAIEYPGVETQELSGCEEWFEKVVE